jgi:N-acyl-D-amino-acid deacylase
VFDTLITNGRIVDGSGNPWFTADVGISDGRVAALGKLGDGTTAKEVIDAAGHVVAPGFIDIHSHSEFILPQSDHADTLAPFLAQGITTMVTGNCGYAPAPVNPRTLEELKSYTTFLKGAELPWEWRSFGEFLGFLEEHGVAFNVVPMVAHGAIRIHELGFDPRPPSADETAAMKGLLQEAMADGAFGFSTGLLYAPGIFTPPDEIVDLASVLPRDAVYTSHIRGSSETLIPATKELIRVGETNGLAYQHSHLEAFGHDNWQKLETVLRLHEEARDRGVDGGFDVIPYTSANTTLLAILPPWSLEGGVEALLGRLRDPIVRQRIARSIEEDIPGWPCWNPGGWPHNLVEATGWDNISLMWVESEKNKALEGKTIGDIARTKGATPFDVAADLILEERGHAMALFVGVSGDLRDEHWLERAMAHPYAAFETDAIVTGRGVPHPAASGAFPRVIGHFSRGRGLFTMEDAVRRVTSLPAQRFGLKKRGAIRVGNWADIVIFDPETIADRSTHANPSLGPYGIDRVMVNGQTAVMDGAPAPHRRAGHVLRRGGTD